jgi:hypothetical protein
MTHPTGRTGSFTLPVFEKEYKQLVRLVSSFSTEKLKAFMKTSDKLTAETRQLYELFPDVLTPDTAAAAILSFTGDVYQGLKAGEMREDQLQFAQDHVRILSGLYGVLKPLDLIAPYRLEMGSSLKTPKASNLYGFWGQKIATELAKNLEAHPHKILLNLASGEYFSSVDLKVFPYPVYHVEFKENKNGKLAGNSFTNKKMRGVMARFIVRYGIDHPEELKSFSEEGFVFSPAHSTEYQYMFIR